MPTPSQNPTHLALLQATTPPPRSLFRNLITASHILHHQKISLSPHSSISIRNPQDPSKFFLPRALAPHLLTSREEILEYRVQDASRVRRKGEEVEGGEEEEEVKERFIHSEIYKAYAGVQSVVHSHAEATIPFSVGSVPLRAVGYEGAAVMGPSQVPIYDISLHHNSLRSPTSSNPSSSLLITSPQLGESLAAGFSPSSNLSKATSMIKNYITSSQPSAVSYPPHPVVLMRGHGFTCIGRSIEEAVHRAINVCSNARIQMNALLMQTSYNVGLLAERWGAGEKAGPAKQEGIKFVTGKEASDSTEELAAEIQMCWDGWCAEVAEVGLYRNELAEEEAIVA